MCVLFSNSFVFDVLTTSHTTSVAAMVFHFVHQKATQTYSSFIYIIYETILYTAHSLRSKRFRLVSGQGNTEEGDFRF